MNTMTNKATKKNVATKETSLRVSVEDLNKNAIVSILEGTETEVNDTLHVTTRLEWRIEHESNGFHYRAPYKHGFLYMKQSWNKTGWKISYESPYDKAYYMDAPVKDVNVLALRADEYYCEKTAK